MTDSPSRRAFLKQSALLGGATAAAVVAPGVAADAMQETATPEPQPTQQGYRETEHVKAYYRTLRDA